jgi:hypothetical protein
LDDGEPSKLGFADTVMCYENTMAKVWAALHKTGLDDSQIVNAVTAMQNEGILFREIMP